jgi:uncharacterized protein
MKLLLLLFAVFALLWLLRRTVRNKLPPRTDARSAVVPHEMVACAMCGLHLPRAEALPGRGGVFCGEAHRTAFETAHPEA